MAFPNKLMSQAKPPAKLELKAPKPLHNELWTIRSLAQQHLAGIGKSDQTIVLTAQEVRLLLGTLVSLIKGEQPKIDEMQASAAAFVAKAMQESTDAITKALEEQ